MTPTYDRELIARMLADYMWPDKVAGRAHRVESIQEQIDALNAADNADSSGVHTARADVAQMDAITTAYNAWPADIRKKLSLHDLRRMTGWVPPVATIAPAEAKGDAFPERYGCNGPEGSFWTDDSALADKLISASFDRDEWTVTDTMPRGEITPQPADGGAAALDYTDIANRVQAITGRSVWPSTVKAILEVAHPPAAQVQHPDDVAVDLFAGAMKDKLAVARAKGRGGWEDKSQCSQQHLSDLLRGHVEKGDPRDVANFCMMLWCRHEGIAKAAQVQKEAVGLQEQANRLGYEMVEQMELAHLRERARAKLAVRDGEVWFWQCDGYDFPESLTCPVVMPARVLRELIATHPTGDALGAVRDRWVKQTTFFQPDDAENPNKGNCSETAVACLLGIPVPEKFGPSGVVTDFWGDFEACFARHGFTVFMEGGNHRHDGLYLASGPSDRGCSHMVVMRDGKLVHDPHPSNAGIQSIEHVWVAVPIDPALQHHGDSRGGEASGG